MFSKCVARVRSAAPLLRHYSKQSSIVMPKFSTVTHLSTILKCPLSHVQETMRNMGFSSTNWDYIVDDESAVLIADELGIKSEINTNHGEDLYPQSLPDSLSAFPPRPAVVALMGHVDHGKTSLLDYFRRSRIVSGEKGGITQHIGAFLTDIGKKSTICFLDTPGHEAFLKLRQRGANLTDIVLLCVAADDSVMPQTKEAIRHASAAGVPMLVALTKCDKPDSNPDKVIADLAGAGVDVEAYGGETQCIPVSALTGKGMPDLVAALQAQIEIQDVRAPTKGYVAEGVIVESSVAKGIGPAASMIVRKGVLKPRQIVVAGTSWCRVRQLTNENGKSLKEAPPGTPVRITGWKDLPEPGDTVLEAPQGELQAKKVTENRKKLLEAAQEAKQISIMNENKTAQLEEAKLKAEQDERASLGLANTEQRRPEQSGPKQVPFIVKADVAGSAEAVADILAQMGNDEIKATVLFSGVGPVTASDVFRAETAGGATIVAFGPGVTNRQIERLAEQQKVQLRHYDVIYKAMEDISADLSSQLAPIVTRNVIGSADIRMLFQITVKKRTKLNVAGIKVTRGGLASSAPVQVKRAGKIVFEGFLESIQHGKDHVTEAHKGSEYGVTFKDWADFQEGDVIESYEEIKTPRYI